MNIESLLDFLSTNEIAAAFFFWSLHSSKISFNLYQSFILW